jgi:hypothetical protein
MALTSEGLADVSVRASLTTGFHVSSPQLFTADLSEIAGGELRVECAGSVCVRDVIG